MRAPLRVLRRGLRHYEIWAVVGLLALGLFVMAYQVYCAQSALIDRMAMNEVRLYSHVLRQLRSLYTSEVVVPATRAGVRVAHDYQDHEGAIPLPITLSRLLGARLSESTETTLRIFSDYPFPGNTEESGPIDSFEREALVALRAHPERPFHRIETLDGNSIARFAIADRMQASCLGCHNTHPESPKTDWREGDVRGVLAVSMSLDPATALLEDSLLGTFEVAATTSIFSLIAILVATRRFRKDAQHAENLRDDLLLANRDLSRRNQELDEFAQVASHDLQEPLRKLVAYSDLLREDLGSDLPPHAGEDLEYIADAASRMQQLVQDLLALSRTSRKVAARVDVDLGEAADKALERLGAQVEERGATITRDPLPSVQGDPVMITQLYQNLIGNALKFSDQSAVRVHLSAETVGQELVLGVRDSGIGIDPAYAEQIFAPFQRLHSRSAFEGTGIGLAICRKAVERHGGRIWVESRPGEGAHFKFTLPGAGAAVGEIYAV